MQIPRSGHRAGTRVYARGEHWQVIAVEPWAAATVVTLNGTAEGNRGRQTRLIAPFDRLQVQHRAARVAAVGRRRVLLTALAQIRDAPNWCQSPAAPAIDIELRSWQFAAARAVVHGATRVLLADGVGLGKTIQALLAVRELEVRGLAQRVLVLTPAAIRHQWADEMRLRFAMDAQVMDQASVAAAAATLPAGLNPWLAATHTVSSIDFVKRSEVRHAAEEAPLDVLIVDEAHHLTPGSDRAELVAEFAARARWLLLCTATPHSGDEAAFRLLLTLGAVAGAPPTTVIRRTTPPTTEHPTRRTRRLAVRPTPDERALLSETLRYVHAMWSAPHAAAGGRLVAAVIARRAASAAAAASDTLARRRALLAGTLSPVAQPLLPWHEIDEDAVADDDVLALPGLASATEEMAWLDRLLVLAHAARARSSKLAAVQRLLRRRAEPVLLFSEYRDVAEWLAGELSAIAPVAVLHGGQPGHIRRQVLAAFTSGHVRVLCATDAASEGLNLQHRCRLVVSFETPWNPLRLEQRAGRVDRLGQQRRVHAIQLVHRGSFEGRVLAHLDARRDRASAAVADSRAAEAARLRRFTAPGALARRLQSIQAVPSRRRAGAVVCWPSRGAGDGGGGRVLLYACDLHDAPGRLIERHHAALVWHGPRRSRRDPGAVKQLNATIADTGLVARAVARRRRHLVRAVVASTTPMLARAQAIRAALERRRRSTWSQSSLFPGRDGEGAASRRVVIDRWIAHLDHEIAGLGDLRSISVGHPALVASWPWR